MRITKQSFVAFAVLAFVLCTVPLARAFPIITNVVETGGDLDLSGGFYDTGPAKWTGVTFSSHQAGEPVPGLAAGAAYTVPLFGNWAPTFVDRAHRYTNASATVLMPSYLAGGEYIMSGNDNRDNTSYRLDVSVAVGVRVYMLIDNRLSPATEPTANSDNPPTLGASAMQWILDEGWAPVRNGINRTANSTWPDEIGVDESSDGTINQWYSIYSKLFPAGTFQLKQADNAGRNMYGAVVKVAVPPPTPTGLAGVSFDTKVRLEWTASPSANSYIVKRSGTASGPYSPVLTNSTTSCFDTGLVNDTTYYYVVSAVGEGGESVNSIELAIAPKTGPASVVAVGGTNEIALTWAAFPGAASYTIQRSDSAAGPFTTIATGNAPAYYSDDSPLSGRTYYYVVSAQLSAGGESGFSGPVVATTAPSVPALTASLFASTVIRIGWTTPDLVVSQFVLEQSTDGVTFAPLATLPGSARSYTNSGLTLSTTYSYRVKAANATGPTDYSSIASLTTPAFGWNVNFAATNFTTGTTGYPIPGYLDDYGYVLTTWPGGLTYGWDADNTQHGRLRNSANAPERRYDTFNHMQKATPVPFGRAWDIQIPNGFYQVRIVGGDPDNFDSVLQFDIEGVITPTYTAVTAARWGEFTKTVIVNDGSLTISNGPAAANNKISFIDIYPAVPVPLAFSVQPQTQTILQNRPVTFTAAVNAGSEPFFYQWYLNDVEIPGASGRGSELPFAVSHTITFPQPVTDEGNYYVVFTNYAGAVTSSVAALTVEADLAGPILLSAGSVDGLTIGLQYNELLSTNTTGELVGGGIDVFNYAVNGGAVNVLTADWGKDSSSVILGLDPTTPVYGGFTVAIYAMTIRDRADNAVEVDQEIASQALGLTTLDIGVLGTPAGPAGTTLITNGTSISYSNAAATVTADGRDIWDVADGFYYAYRSVTGNFDTKVRVESLTRPDTWTKAGLMARATTNINSRNIGFFATPTTGQNLHTFQWRDADFASSGSFYTTNNPPPYPNAWVRLQRLGSLFVASISSNDVDWVTYAARDTATNQGGAFPATLLVGLATTSHNTNNYTVAVAEYRDFSLPFAPTIVTQPAPADQVVSVHANVSYTVAAVGAGTLRYQWRKNGNAISGATTDTLTLNNVGVADAGSYTVSIGNDGGEVVSVAVTLGVNNQLPVVVAESISSTQNLALTIPAADLLANDTDGDGDPLSILAVSGIAPVTFSANFNDGLLPAGATNYGASGGGLIELTGGPDNSGCLKLTMAAANQQGAFVIDELTPGRQVAGFLASFNLRIGDGSAEPADGFSFNFAPNLPNATSGTAEDGVGTGISFCIDTYRFTGAANTSGMRVNYGGTNLASVQIPTWGGTNSGVAPRYVPVAITFNPDGTLVVYVDGTNVFGTVTVPYVPTVGRFGLYARCGGSFQAQWVDDLSITVLTLQTGLGNISNGGTVTLAGGNVTYTPPANTCGNDSFVYLVTDGQAGVAVVDTVTVNLADVSAPVITACAPNQTISVDATCQAAVPDLTSLVIATESCSPATISQVPAAGTLVGLGDTVVTLSVRDDSNNVATCTATVTVVDTTPPAITACAPDVTVAVDAACLVPMPDMVALVAAADNCLAVVVTQFPLAGTPVGPGVHPVIFSATDGANNISTCTNLVTVLDPLPPAITACAADVTLDLDANCQVAVPDLAAQVTATDNCSVTGISQVPAAGTLIGLGSTVVTLAARDAASNVVTCTATITTRDTNAPVIAQCLTTALVQLDVNSTSGTVPDLTTNVVASDTCSAITITQDPPAGTTLPLGLAPVVFTITDNSGNAASCTGSVLVARLPSVVVNSPTICIGQDAALAVTTDAENPSYVWSPGGETTSSITVAPTATTTYTVTVIDLATQLSNSAPATVTVNPLPAVSVNSERMCLGGTATLTATTDAQNPSYLWSPGGDTTASITVSPTEQTTYTVTVTDGVTGCQNSGSGTVIVGGLDYFANTTAVLINDNAAATPYPSTISVSGLTATVCRVTVTLSNLAHSFPSDVDVLLVGPNGAYTYLMSDAGSFYGFAGETLTFDDRAAAGLPENDQIVSGAYKPTNFGSKKDGQPDYFLAPAPVGPYPTNLMVFNGIDPNGVWSLYVLDDAVQDAGAIADGWSLGISAVTPFVDMRLAVADAPDPVAVGSNLTYTVLVTNAGPALAEAVTVANVLPAGVSLVSATAGQGSCTPAGGVVNCALGAMGPASAVPVTIVVTAPAAGAYAFSASVGTATFEFATTNNAASTSTTVLDPPMITAAPVDVTVCVNGGAAFVVAAAGEPPLSYQWYKDGVEVPGATGTTLAVGSAQLGDGGSYAVVVQNVVGTTSASATLTVNPLPVVSVAGATICQLQSATLTAAHNAASATFLWSPGGETTESITVSPMADTVYTVLVTDGVTGCTNSATALVTVNQLTAATGLVSQTNVCPGSAVSFGPTVASGTGPFTYQWYKDGAALGGAVSNSYSIAAASAGDAGNYCVVVTGLCNSVTNCASLHVVAAPVITGQPRDTATPMGNSATFSVVATGTVAPTYQWLLNGAPIDGATANAVTVNNVTLAQSGSSYQVVVGNCAGSVTSAVANLTVAPVAGISFDFNTPGQFVNTPYNLVTNDWLSLGLANPVVESAADGIGGSRGLDVTGTADVTEILQAPTFDFSLNGKTLVASVMVKIRDSGQDNRNTQLGFVTATNVFDNATSGTARGIADFNPQGYMNVVLRCTANASETYQLRLEHRRTDGGAAEVTLAPTAALTIGKWYKFTGTFQNIKDTTANTLTIAASLQDMGTDGLTPGSVVLGFGATNIVNASLVTNKFMYLAVRTIRSDTGVDSWDNLHAYTASGDVAVVTPPASQTVLQGRTATFRALVDGTGPYGYQWQRFDGLGGFTNIPLAGNWKYITAPVLLADDGAQFRVIVTNGTSTVTSEPAILTVQPDALAVVSVGSADGNVVGVRFNQPVEGTSAGTAANYLVNGVPAAKAVLRADRQTVLLTAPALLTGGFTVSVQNVLDLSGGAVGVANTADGVVLGLASLDISQATAVVQPVGTTYSFAPNALEVTAGGVDVWNLSDSFRYVYTLKTGDFDVKMRVPYMDIVRGSSKAGLIARASLEPTSPMVFASPNPLWPARQYYEGSRRDGYNLSAVAWGTTTRVLFPEAWLRLRRVANTFSRYSSTNGVNWVLDGQTTLVLPETVYFGLGVCSVANTIPPSPMTAQIDNYGDFGGYPGAIVTLTTQPTNMTVNAGSSALNAVAAAVTGAASSELAFAWQRNDGAGNWTNLPTAGLNNGALNTGALMFTDNGAQYRCVVSLLGAASVTSDVVTVTVNDTAAPSLASATLPVLATYNIQLNFSEAMGASALDPVNYTVTNSAGMPNPVLSAVFMGGDPRVVTLTVRDLLVQGNYGLAINNLADLKGNPLPAAFRAVTQAATPPQQPVVVDLWFGLPAPSSQSLTDLVYGISYAQNTPDLVAYTNVFALNQWGAANFSDSGSNRYGARLYSYFVPPTNGQYKFWLRCDDFAEFIMNTNTTGSTSSAMDIVTSIAGTSPAIEMPYKAFDNNIYTKFLCNLGANAGVIVTPTRGPSVVTGVRFTSANDVEGRDPVTWTLEGGNSASGPWTVIASGNTGLPAGRLTTASAVTFANATAYTSYRLVFPTVKDPTLNITQIAEIELLNSAGVDVTGQDAIPQIVMTGNNSAYGAGRAATNTLVGGQRYYMEVRFKEGTGGDGVSVAVRNDNTVPGQGEVITANFLAFPTERAQPTPVLAELYQWYPTPYGPLGFFGNTLPDLNWARSNSIFLVQGLPTIFGYERYFGYRTNTTDSSGQAYDNNYFGRLYSYFVAPSNGLYRFYLRVDDVAQLYMNTNAVGSTNPAGKVFMGQTANAFVSGAPYQLVAQNVSLNAGQRYYTEVWWKEGTGGDGVTMAVRAQSSTATPPTTEVAAGSLFEHPVDLDPRIGPLDAQISPVDPVVTDGQTLTFTAVGLKGITPYTYLWLKNGQPVYYGTPYLNCPFFTTQPLNASDNGAVFTLVVSNGFSRVERSTTVTVVPSSPATLVSVVGSQYGNAVMLTFSEVMDPITAQSVGYYTIPGLSIRSALLDDGGYGVTLETSPQVPGTVYTLTVNGVRERSLPGDVVNATKTFTAWNVGGEGVYVEVFTNINGTTIANLTNDPRFMGNFPDVSGYSTRFAYDSRSGQTFSTALGSFGPFAGDGLSFYGARLTGLFRAPTNGVYKFYLLSDDSSQLFMNTNAVNSTDPAGRVLIAKLDGANLGWSTNLAMRSPDIALNGGQLYYMEALLKEGGGGDYINVLVRTSTDAVPADRLAEAIPGTMFAAVGNPDVNQINITQAPPAVTNVYESDPILLEVVATRSPASLPPITYTWERSEDGGVTFAPIPGATGPSYLRWVETADDNALFRVTLQVPGNRQSLTTQVILLGPDTTPPQVVSAGSLDGTSIGILFSERVHELEAADPFNYMVTSPNGVANVIGAVLRPDQRSVIITLEPSMPIGTPFQLEAYAVTDVAQAPNVTDVSSVEGRVEYVTPRDIGVAGLIAAGGYNPLVPSSAYTATNGAIDISANGWDIWNAADGFHFASRPVTGNFDVKVRVQSLKGADQWSKAGLMARPSLTNNSRFINLAVTPRTTPIGSQAPVNNYSFQWRDTDGGTPASIHAGSNGGATVPPPYPNAWVRLQRFGSLFVGLYSSNDVDWVVYAARDTATNTGGAFPDTLELGLATVSHDQTRSLNNNAVVEYRDLYFPLPPAIVTQPAPDYQVVPIHTSVSYTVVGAGDGLKYQWKANGADIVDATNATLNITDTSVAVSGAVTVFVYNDGGAVVSTPVMLVVSNSLPVVLNLSTNTVQNVGLSLSAAELLAGSSDPEGDPLAFLGIVGSALAPTATWSANFNDLQVPAGSWIYGVTNYNVAAIPQMPLIEAGGPDASACLKLTPNANYMAGVMLVSNFNGGQVMPILRASFKVRIGDGTADAADGMSFNFAPIDSLPRDYVTTSEDGVTTNGLAVAIDNYPAAGPGAPAVKIRWQNAIISTTLIWKWNSPEWVTVQVNLDSDGKLTVSTNGVPLVSNLALPGYVAFAGEFGLYARTGGQNQTHWVDDVSIEVLDVRQVRTARGGVALYDGANIVYTPAPDTCGLDSFTYVVSDGQQGGTNVGTITVRVDEAVPTAPVITSCPANVTLVADAACQAAVPNLATNLVATDNCCCVRVTQVPAAGTLLAPGVHTITFTATDEMGLAATCQATLTIVDTTAPSFVCPAARTLNANPNQGNVLPLPDLTVGLVMADECGTVTATQNPAAGTVVGAGVHPVQVTVTDGSGNTAGCTVAVTVVEVAPYVQTILAQNPIAYWRFNDGVSTPVLDAAINLGTLGTAADGVYSGLPLHQQAGALAGSSDKGTKFNGSTQGAQVPYAAAVNPQAPFTIEGWAKPDTIRAAGSLVSPFASLRRASPAAEGWIIYQDAGGWNFRLGDSANNYTVNLTGGGAPDTNTWYHLVLTYDGATAICYVNGVEVARKDETRFVPNPSIPLGIGMRGDNSFFFPGTVDEVAVYTNILSATDVSDHYQNGISATPAVPYENLVLAQNPVGYWRLNEAAFVAPIALNSGSLGAAANGGYYGGATDGAEAPRYPQFVGFESGNTALQLDGVNDFVGTLISLMNNRPVFTISGWIRRAGDQADRTGLWGQNDLIEFGYINNNTVQAWTDAGLDISPNPFPNGQWSHLALVSDGPTLTIYTNGVVAGSRAHALPNGGVSAYNFNVGGGGIFDGAGNYFNGQIDELAVFDRALTPANLAEQVVSAVPTAPRITVDLPGSTNFYVGDTLVLAPGVVGTPPFRYQWYFYSDPLVDQTNAALVIADVTDVASGLYTVEIANDFGGPVASAPCEVFVLDQAPTIAQQPVAVTVYPGYNVSFSVVGYGGQFMTYQWRKGSVDITDATNATLLLTGVQPADAADYRVILTNPAGSTESDPATLTVLVPPAGTFEAGIVSLGPVAYWRGNEAAGPVVYDYAGLHHGTAAGGMVFGAAGPLAPEYPGFGSANGSLQYNGVDSVVSVSPSPANNLAAFTLAGWIKLAAAPAARTALFGQNDALEFGFHGADTIGIWSPTGDYLEAPHGFALNQWYFVVATGDGTNMALYINGGSVAVGGAATGNYGSSGYPFNIGAMVLDASGNYFNGLIDEVALYNRALSANEICQLYVNTVGHGARLEFAASVVVMDSKPVGAPLNGSNRGATWLAESADGVAAPRSGVMLFNPAVGSQVTVPANAAFNSPTGTIAFWMRSAGNAGGGNEGALLFDRRTGAGDVIVLWDDGSIFIQPEWMYGANSTKKVADNLWHHVAYVYDQSAAGSIQVYIDGVLDINRANPRAWSWPASQAIELGRSHDSWWKLYNGQMDDFRVYNRGLSAAEIGQLLAGDVVDATALMLRFDFGAAPSAALLWSSSCAILQVTDELLGNGTAVWTDLPGATSPYPIQVVDPKKFYRLKY